MTLKESNKLIYENRVPVVWKEWVSEGKKKQGWCATDEFMLAQGFRRRSEGTGWEDPVSPWNRENKESMDDLVSNANRIFGEK